MKKYLTVFSLLCVFLCCGFTYRGDWSNVTFTVTEDFVSNDTEGLGVISLQQAEGTGEVFTIQLPCKASLIEKAGYTILEDEREFPPMTESYGTYAYDSQGRYLSLSVKNDTDKTADVSDCTVYGVNYSASEDTEYGLLEFKVKGWSPDQSITEATNCFGLPANSFEVSGMTYTTWETPKGEYTVSLDSDVNGNAVKVSIRVDTPKGEYESRYLYGTDYSGLLTESEHVGGSETKQTVLVVVFGAATFIIALIIVLVFVVQNAVHKRQAAIRQAELDLQILNAEIEEDTVDEELLRKYGKED